MQRTPLYDEHVKLQGKIVEFAGWEMPVRYSGFSAEHEAVRNGCGLFDVSHMGEVWVTGPEALKAVNYLTCNDVSQLYDGKAQYSAILNENAGVIDDIIVYRFSEQRFLICVNASNADQDYEWLKSKNKFNAKVENASAAFGQIALQGPKAVSVLATLIPAADVKDLKVFHFIEKEIAGAATIIARTGYTGEDGVEIFTPAASTAHVWREILKAGTQLGLIPCGLGARDTLRLEAALPLHGHELGPDISAFESGLAWIVKLDKGDFIGRAALVKEKEQGSKRTLIGFEIDDAGIARHGDKVFDESENEIGVVVSGSKTPTLNKSLGMALIKSGVAKEGSAITFLVREKKLKGHVVKRPFYKRPKV